MRNWLFIAAAEIFGLAIVGAAFLLSWAAEVLQLDVSQGLALGLLAPIAVLPDYIVDATFAWKAAQKPACTEYAVAIMTGAVRMQGPKVMMFPYRDSVRSLHDGTGSGAATVR